MAGLGYFRTYATPDGESHFEDLEMGLALGDMRDWRSKLVTTPGVTFRRSPVDEYHDFHTAPRRQFVITIAGEAEIQTSDGQVRRVGPGSIMLAEDTTGKGHITRAVGGTERISIFVPVNEGTTIG